MATSLGVKNPFRYRGYYFDTETGLYYLQSRYYDPQVGRFLNGDEPAFVGASGSLFSNNLYAYCENNPIMNSDPSGYGTIGAIIGAILGFGLGAILVPYVADLLHLKGWKRKVFTWVGVAAITALGAYVGYYVGEAIFKIYQSGGTIASKINGVIAKGIAKLVGGTLAEAKGEGIKITVGKLMIRIMTEAGGRTNYFKLSYIGKQAFDIFGQVTNDPSKLHIPITIENIVRLIDLIFKLK